MDFTDSLTTNLNQISRVYTKIWKLMYSNLWVSIGHNVNKNDLWSSEVLWRGLKEFPQSIWLHLASPVKYGQGRHFLWCFRICPLDGSILLIVFNEEEMQELIEF